MKPKVSCAKCGERKHHNIHAASTWEHDFVNPKRPGLNPTSASKREYLKSDDHIRAYEDVFSNGCAADAAGAPTACMGAMTPHHIAPRGAFGGQRAAERFPVITLCVFHNEWVQQDVRGREWARSHYFHRDGTDWPFLLSPKDAPVMCTVEDL